MAVSMKTLVSVLALSNAAGVKQGTALQNHGRANPIRRVVTMLQKMQAKVTEEGKKEEELYNKFACYCKTGSGDLSASIADAQDKVPQLESELKEAEALLSQLKDELAQHKKDRADAKDSLAQATALREKEAAAYAKDSGDLTANIAALAKAINAIEKGAAGSFLQTSSAGALRKLVVDAEMSSTDRDMLSSFLSEDQDEGYVPQSGQITGILKQLKDTMEKDLADITAAEKAAIQAFEGLAAAKQKEIEANTAAVEAKTKRQGETAVAIVNIKEDLGDTGKALIDDKKFLADLGKNCDVKKAEWEERSKTRSDELLALADTIKLLNDDDALDLFKKTLPSAASASFLQTSVTAKDVKNRALAALQKSRGSQDFRLDLIAMALKGHSKGFGKLIKLIDNMVALLAKEQGDDDSKKAFCESELDKAEDKKKGLDTNIADLEKSIEDAKGSAATLTEEVASLSAGIKALDKQVAEATELRKTESAENKETVASDGAAKEIITIAKNRLAKFYTPKLYKPAPKAELSAEERVAVSMGGTATPTPAPGGIAGTGVTAFVQDSSDVAPPPPPATWDAYQQKGQEHTGVVEMMNILMADLDKEIQETEVNEKESQSEYETFMADSSKKRAEDSKSIATKEAAKADLDSDLQQMTEEKDVTMKESYATAKYIRDLHKTCDWLLSTFETRKEARAGEVESLKNAKAVLSGADYSLLQTSYSTVRRHLRRIRA